MRLQAISTLLFAVLFITACQDAATDNENGTPGADQVPPAPSEPVDAPASDASQADVTFRLTGENFKFLMDGETNPELRVQQGDLVRIEFTSTQGFHDWVVDEFSAATEQVYPENGTTVVEFRADQAGTFEYYCSVGKHRENGMRGNLVVE